MSCCADLRGDERALVVCDPGTRTVADAIAAAARETGAPVELLEIPPFAIHGEEPPADLAAAMSAADVVFGLTAMSMAHSEACRRAISAGARYLSLPDYSHAVLGGRALGMDFRTLSETARLLARAFTAGRAVRLTAPTGTDISFDISGRRGNAAPGWCDGPGTLASPPDAEANVAPVEDGTEGTLVVDGSIPCVELGMLSAPLTLRVEKGRIQAIQGRAAEKLGALIIRPGDPARQVVAELGIGLNPLASVAGSMLEDEGALGTVHVGLGSNTALGGRNRVEFHLDHVLRAPTVLVDGRAIMHDGKLLV